MEKEQYIFILQRGGTDKVKPIKGPHEKRGKYEPLVGLKETGLNR